MTKTSKKGFTLVELVIVIAVIAILAAVLIPTFANVQEKAKAAALQETLSNAETKFKTELPSVDNYYLVYDDKAYVRNDDNEFEEDEDLTASLQAERTNGHYYVIATVTTASDAGVDYYMVNTSLTDENYRNNYVTYAEATPAPTKYTLESKFNSVEFFFEVK